MITRKNIDASFIDNRDAATAFETEVLYQTSEIVGIAPWALEHAVALKRLPSPLQAGEFVFTDYLSEVRTAMQTPLFWQFLVITSLDLEDMSMDLTDEKAWVAREIRGGGAVKTAAASR